MAKSKEQKAVGEIAEIMKEIDSLLDKAEKIAEANAVKFAFSLESRGRDSYGNGLTYHPASLGEGWGASDEYGNSSSPNGGRWVSSSDYC